MMMLMIGDFSTTTVFRIAVMNPFNSVDLVEDDDSGIDDVRVVQTQNSK